MPQTPSFFLQRGLSLYDHLAGQRLSLRSGATSATQPVGGSESSMDATIGSRLSLALLLCGGFTLAGCRSPQPTIQPISLCSNESVMKAEVLQHIPVGTSIQDAERIMKQSGFECSFVEADGTNPPFLFCDIHKTEKWPVSRRWMISIQYTQDEVTDVTVGTGLIGP
jgi:hypothetical protein